jgi:hypothetical protein
VLEDKKATTWTNKAAIDINASGEWSTFKTVAEELQKL